MPQRGTASLKGLCERGHPITNKPVEQVRLHSLSRARDHACLCARVADEYRGKDTLVLDLTRVTPIVDYFVITTATSGRQMHAIADEVSRTLTGEGSTRLGVEGADGNSWILLDYGDIVLHVFTQEARDTYDLEHLWADADRVDWQANGADDQNR